MTLLFTLLLLTVALAVLVRMLDTRRTAGWVMLGIMALGMTALATSRLARPGTCSGSDLTDRCEALADTASVSEAVAADPQPAEFEVAEVAAPAGQLVLAERPLADTAEAVEGGDDALTIDTEAEAGQVVIPPRPAWVESEDVREGELHTTAVSSGPHEIERDCRSYLDRELKRAVDSYVDFYLGRVYGDQFKASTFVSYDLPYIKKHLLRPGAVHHEVIKVSFGPMHQKHALLEFGPKFRSELDGRRGELERHWREWVVKGRLWGTALGLGTILALLSVFFGYSRADTATRGFYTGRLQLAATVVILTIIAAGALLALQLVA